mmetsp:Transcript_39623/g.64049  ORF Transcript_39623/g.64049 Transcript_39623/m.64049 type:complete len:374 (+) Transcript_39623:1896-3017(+)
MALQGTPWQSTTAPRRLWRRRMCSRCTPSCSERLPSCLVRPGLARSTTRPSRHCRRTVSRTPACATQRWRRCSERWTVPVPSTSTHLSFATQERKRSFGRSGAATRCSTVTRIRSVTCCASSVASRPCSPRFTSTPQISRQKQDQRARSSTRWRPQKRPSSRKKRRSARAELSVRTPSASASPPTLSLRARNCSGITSLPMASRGLGRASSSSWASGASVTTRTPPPRSSRRGPGQLPMQSGRPRKPSARRPLRIPRRSSSTWTMMRRTRKKPLLLRQRRVWLRTPRRSRSTSKTSKPRIFRRGSSEAACLAFVPTWRKRCMRSLPSCPTSQRRRKRQTHCPSSRRCPRVRARVASDEPFRSSFIEKGWFCCS